VKKNGLDLAGSGQSPVAEYCGQGNEFPGSTNEGRVLDQLTTNQISNKALVSVYADTFPFMTADYLLSRPHFPPCLSLPVEGIIIRD
jgi:hypothetical protein